MELFQPPPPQRAPSPGSIDLSRLHIGNLPYRIQRDTNKDFFASAGFDISAVDISIDPFTGRNPGYCFVNFRESEEASRAMETLNGREIEGKALRIGKARRPHPRTAADEVSSRIRNWDGQRMGESGAMQRERMCTGYPHPAG